jgi:hypothetical protein
VEIAVRPPLGLLIGSALAALVLALVLWALLTHVITVAHEGGHAFTASAAGGSVASIQVAPAGRGATEMYPAGWLSNVLSTAAGYLGPSVWGVCGAILLHEGIVTPMLWLTVGMLVCVSVLAKDLFTVGVTVLVGASVFAVVVWCGHGFQTFFAYTLIWFLLIGGMRSVLELSRFRQTSRSDTSSDAFHMARLTHLPGCLWVGFFGLVNLVALALGSMILIHTV